VNSGIWIHDSRPLHGFTIHGPFTKARNLRHTYVIPSENRQSWRIQQMLVDPEEHNDWMTEFEADLPQSRAANELVLRLRRIGSLV